MVILCVEAIMAFVTYRDQLKQKLVSDVCVGLMVNLRCRCFTTSLTNTASTLKNEYPLSLPGIAFKIGVVIPEPRSLPLILKKRVFLSNFFKLGFSVFEILRIGNGIR
ncbi:hypothetical protein A6U96_19095 [Agrobacterium tumefaciens]|nr:hypothetical protein A6U96_19095 [Agrobacterium tumefaciens]